MAKLSESKEQLEALRQDYLKQLRASAKNLRNLLRLRHRTAVPAHIELEQRTLNGLIEILMTKPFSMEYSDIEKELEKE